MRHAEAIVVVFEGTGFKGHTCVLRRDAAPVPLRRAAAASEP
jgi:hypothetical protein